MIILVVISTLLFLASTDTRNTGSSKGCRFRPLYTFCVGLNLTYIPEIPVTNIELRFDRNYLPYINVTTLSNVSNAAIKLFFLKFNGIKTIEENAFQNISTLHRLDLSWNNLAKFNSILKQNKKLQILNLQGNQISSVTLDFNPYLEKLSLGNNSLRDLPNFCGPRVFYPNLTYLKLNNNKIDNFIPGHINCMKKLDYLDLSFNALGILKTDNFHYLPSLRWLSLYEQKNPSPPFIIQERAFNNSHLKELRLSRNTLTSANLSPQAFDGCVCLQLLRLMGNYLGDDIDILSKALSPLTSLETLVLADTRLFSLPKVIGEKLHKLKYLDVKFNKIKSWPMNFFKNNIELSDINIKQNSIETVTRGMFPVQLRSTLKTISLDHNPFICNCDIYWFIQWIRSEKHKFVDYPKGYRCLNITEKICLNNSETYNVVTIVVCVLLLVIVSASFVYKYRWHIKYHIYIWRYRQKQLMHIAEKQFVYDVFVSYCVENSNWVFDNLVHHLEEDAHVKLCIHERDFLGGKLIIDNIIQHMENSRKILIILSNEFARRQWCQFEMSLAQNLVLDMSIESIVVVFLEEIEAVNMSKSLHALLKTTTYITWNGDVEGLFWERLKASILT
ncbi:toll-like receptor 13 [Patella vulgata]|uniref:toll-like receptor 13 n=1 Tax=Patella vulgata TaxID=6465 RepID=UPI0024A81786|nr:toll-like receptor 13 [Patella vulgata]XP_055956139.1 toll-like receptor 13 [Patella vulgata]